MMNIADGKVSPKRWRWQFSLRSLLIGVTVFAIPCGWLGVKIEKARKQKAAVAAIHKNGGGVAYDYQRESDGNFNQLSHPPAPDWLRGILGDDFFSTVILAEVYTDGGAEHLEELPGLQRVHLLGPGISDIGMRHLKGLSQLEFLSIGTYDGASSRVTDKGMESLRGMDSLRYLYIIGANITDAGITNLQDLQQLESLGLQSTRVTDAGLRDLHGLSRLRVLGLYSDEFTAAGLDDLRHLTHLEHLTIKSTRVNDEEVAKLRQMLPKCQIEH